MLHSLSPGLSPIPGLLFKILRTKFMSDIIESIKSDIDELSIKDIEKIRDYCDSLLKSFYDDIQECFGDIQE